MFFIMLFRVLLIVVEILFFGTLFTAGVFAVKSLLERGTDVKGFKAWKLELAEAEACRDSELFSQDVDWEYVTEMGTLIDQIKAKKPTIPKWMFWVK